MTTIMYYINIYFYPNMNVLENYTPHGITCDLKYLNK